MSPDSVTHVERERTKRVVYAVIYGVGKLDINFWVYFGWGFWPLNCAASWLFCVGKERLAEILNVDSTIAKELRASFLRTFLFSSKIILNIMTNSVLCAQKNSQTYKSLSPAPFLKLERKVHTTNSKTLFPAVYNLLACYELVHVGCLSTICKRKRWFPNLNSANPQLKSHAERQAVNFPVQGELTIWRGAPLIRIILMLQ